MYEVNIFLHRFLMTATADRSIIIYSLFTKNSFYCKCKESQIRKANNRYNIRLMYTYYICQLSLDRRNNASTHDHHDKESRPLCGIFPKAGNRQRKDGWPHNGAAQATTKKRIYSNRSFCK